MGVDCRWAGNAPMGVVAKAAGLLMGCQRSFDPICGWVNVKGVTEGTTHVPTLGEILIDLDPEALPAWNVNGTGMRALWWHHESGRGLRSVSCRAAACNVALVRALGRLFGGTVTIEDTGGTPDEVYPPPAVDVWVEDDAGWYQVQALLAAIQPLTQVEIDAAAEHAAYGGEQ